MTSGGTTWQAIDTLYLTTGNLAVGLTNNANGYVIADAVMLVRDDPQPLDQSAPSSGGSPATSSTPVSGSAPSGAGLMPAVADHNPLMPDDVNDDGKVTPLDALIIINSRCSPLPQSCRSPRPLSSSAVRKFPARLNSSMSTTTGA